MNRRRCQHKLSPRSLDPDESIFFFFCLVIFRIRRAVAPVCAYFSVFGLRSETHLITHFPAHVTRIASINRTTTSKQNVTDPPTLTLSYTNLNYGFSKNRYKKKKAFTAVRIYSPWKTTRRFLQQKKTMFIRCIYLCIFFFFFWRRQSLYGEQNRKCIRNLSTTVCRERTTYGKTIDIKLVAINRIIV